MVQKQHKPTSESVTFSRLASYLECQRKEWYSYRAGGCGVVLFPPPVPFVEGQFLHYLLAHFYKGSKMQRAHFVDRIEKTITANQYATEEAVENVRRKLHIALAASTAYSVRYKTDFSQYKVLYVEAPFTTALGSVTLEGKVDLVLRDKSSGTIGFFEHKFLSYYDADHWALLPMSLQRVMYVLGVKALTGQYPSWACWNVILKANLRRKVSKTGAKESWEEFDARLVERYKEDSSLLFRTPPVVTNQEDLERSVLPWLMNVARKVVEPQESLPPPNPTACISYGRVCPYAEACLAVLHGDKEGWNHPSCRGKYILKTEQHPELED
ncbi:MAG: PD-(D/E)XK nuclease family protein [Candidatus Methanomethylicaceae archaeon]